MAKTDIEQLKLFKCCPDGNGRGRYGAKVPLVPWSDEAQRGVRNLRPVRPPKYATIGLDPEQICAAVGYDDEGGYVFLKVLAVALHLHGKRLGDQLLQRVIDDVTERAMDRLSDEFAFSSPYEIEFEAKVHQDNQPSHRLMERWGFERAGDDCEYEIWKTVLLIAGA